MSRTCLLVLLRRLAGQDRQVEGEQVVLVRETCEVCIVHGGGILGLLSRGGPSWKGASSMDAVLSHLRTVEARVKSLSPQHALAFGLACVERLLPLYSRAAMGQPWGRAEVLRSAVDEAWSALLTGGRLREDLGEACRVAIPPDEVLSGPETAVAHTIGNGVADFLESAGEGDFGYAHFMADRVVDIIDLFEHELHLGPEVMGPLLRDELAWQDETLNLLERSSSLAIAAELRSRNGGIRLPWNALL